MGIFITKLASENIDLLYSNLYNYLPKKIGNQGVIESGEAREWQPNENEAAKIPTTEKARKKIYWYSLQETDYLLTRLFSRFNEVVTFEYTNKLESHFRTNTGADFEYLREGLPRGKNFYSIRTSIKNRIRTLIETPISFWTENLNDNSLTGHIEFGYLTPLIDELPYSAVIGGIQKVVVYINKLNLKHTPYSLTSNGIIPESYKYSINLTIEIWDNYGVDQGDFEDFDLASLADGGGLVSFWVLQHQRSYKPLINKLICRNVIISDYFIK
jgi:hypothetical protein